jgi:hypothetical protein
MMKYLVMTVCAAVLSTNALFAVPSNYKCKKKKKNQSSYVYDSCDECKKKKRSNQGA